jgi:RimJ/RimL family protein N-acetyltransferase
MNEPSSLEVLEDRLNGYRDDLFSGRSALFALMDPDETEVLGGVGLYRRIGPGGLEIGYWVRSDQVGQGLATEAAQAMTDVGFMLTGIERMEIHCDPLNRPSIAVPKKLGYELAETLVDHAVGPTGAPRDTMIWRLTPEVYGVIR